MGRILALVGMGVRVGACAGTLYLLNDIGAFGDIKKGEAAYNKVRSLTVVDLVGPEAAEYLPAIQMPKEIESGLSTVSSTTKDVTKNFGSYWNSGVNSTFSGLRSLPDTVKEYSALAVEEINKNIK